MSNRIITIEREYASGGREVGELVAKQLGIPFYNREILEMASERCGVSVDYLLGRSSEAGSSRAGRHGNSLGPLTVEENKALGQYLAFLRSRYGNEKAQAES